ncbi:MAG: hypothetical protein CL912_21210 [Deltaproteobacteria bacterium]|nr:hypothetical protein [Deltaproteobacteria bacterium]
MPATPASVAVSVGTTEQLNEPAMVSKECVVPYPEVQKSKVARVQQRSSSTTRLQKEQRNREKEKLVQ